MPMPPKASWKQLAPVLDELLDLSPQAATLRIAQIRDGDAALGTQLCRLFAARDRTASTGMLERLAPRPSAFRASHVGRRIGDARIDALLGEGSSGSVWSATRVVDGATERVAIKLLHPSLAGGTGGDGFRREGEILRLLVHPNIVELLDTGVTGAGEPYLVLELVEGSTMDAFCDANRLGVRARITLFLQVVAAVGHAHAASVLHRDLKPANIHVTAGGVAKLLDFGIARSVGANARAAFTVVGRRVLTPLYAAPEQLQGAELTLSSDVYALGVLLFQLLTATHPTARGATSAQQIMDTILHAPPLGLGEVWERKLGTSAFERLAAARGTHPQSLNRHLMEPGLNRVLARALQKNPRHRHADAAEFARDLSSTLTFDA